MAIDDELVHRQQLDRRDPEIEEVLDHRIAAEPEIRAAQMLGHLGMQLRHPFDVALVDDRAIPRHAQRPVIFPGERGIDDDALRNAAGAVVGIGLEILEGRADLVGEERIAPLDGAGDRFRVRIDEQLRGIEAVAVGRIVRSVDAIAVELTGADVRQIAVPDLIGPIAKTDLVRLDSVVLAMKQAQLDRGRVFGKEGEVDALAVPRGAERVWFTGQDAHVWLSCGQSLVVRSWTLPSKQEAGPSVLKLQFSSYRSRQDSYRAIDVCEYLRTLPTFNRIVCAVDASGITAILDKIRHARSRSIRNQRAEAAPRHRRRCTHAGRARSSTFRADVRRRKRSRQPPHASGADVLCGEAAG